MSPVGKKPDEWAEITWFNAMLHEEEQRQLLKENEQRRKLIKHELDRQVQEKRQRKIREQKENEAYEKAQADQVRLLKWQEEEKQQRLNDKVLWNKSLRDQ